MKIPGCNENPANPMGISDWMVTALQALPFDDAKILHQPDIDPVFKAFSIGASYNRVCKLRAFGLAVPTGPATAVSTYWIESDDATNWGIDPDYPATTFYVIRPWAITELGAEVLACVEKMRGYNVRE